MLNLIEKFTPAVEADTNDAGLTTVEYAVAAAVVAAGHRCCLRPPRHERQAAIERPRRRASADRRRDHSGEGFGSSPRPRSHGLHTPLSQRLRSRHRRVRHRGQPAAACSSSPSSRSAHPHQQVRHHQCRQDAARAASLAQGCSGSACTPRRCNDLHDHTGSHRDQRPSTKSYHGGSFRSYPMPPVIGISLTEST